MEKSSLNSGGYKSWILQLGNGCHCTCCL